MIKDAAEPDPARRYKMILRGPRPRTDDAVAPATGADRGVRLGYSPDGIHWTEGPGVRMPQWRDRSLTYGDPGALIRDDQETDPSRRYKLVWQAQVPIDRPDKERGRAKFLSYGPDLEHLRAADHNPILSPGDGFEYENHHVLLAPYRGAWAMPYEYGWYVPNGYGVYGTYCADVRLAVSADGERFERVDVHQPLIPRGGNREWDGGLLVIADKPAIKDGTIHLFYGGNGEEWTSWPGENTPSVYPYGSTGQVRLSRLGLATLREDGWTCPGVGRPGAARLGGHDSHRADRPRHGADGERRGGAPEPELVGGGSAGRRDAGAAGGLSAGGLPGPVHGRVARGSALARRRPRGRGRASVPAEVLALWKGPAPCLRLRRRRRVSEPEAAAVVLGCRPCRADPVDGPGSYRRSVGGGSDSIACRR